MELLPFHPYLKNQNKMKRNLLMALVGVSMICGLFSCQQPAEKQTKEMPMFCTWYTYNENEDFDFQAWIKDNGLEQTYEEYIKCT